MKFSLAIFLLAFFCSESIGQSRPDVRISIDGLARKQQVDGIGVNINSRSWKGEELKPALDLLADSLQAKIFRVIVESPKDWEDINDNDDPFSMNWSYYDSLYETQKFKSVWETIAYLNKKGIRNNVMINLMGYLPKWMGYETIPDDKEDEFVEMLVSFLYYGKEKRKVDFGLLSPFNEADWRNEGPKLDEVKYTRLLHKIVERMDQLKLTGIRLVGPDPADMNAAVKRYIPQMMKDSLVMSRLAHLGVHSYGGYYAKPDSAIKHSAYPRSTYWVTEWNAWRDSLDEGKIGVYDYGFASQCVYYLLDLLKHEATGALVWEGYDSYYDHHAPSLFSYWGILGYDHQKHIYSKRKHFYTIEQVSKFLTPGSWQLELEGYRDSIRTVAFFDPSAKKINIMGVNLYKRAMNVRIALKNLLPVSRFDYFLTDATRDFKKMDPVILNGTDSVMVTIPPQSVFTLSGNMDADASRLKAAAPQPAGWYAGDIHVHRNCGVYSRIYETDTLRQMMAANQLSVISVLADMGNGEVQDAPTDLKKVTGEDDPLSKPGSILHWDAEWHWDATYNNFSNQALGGHLVLLGLKTAKQAWEESPYKILEWAGQQQAVRGFAHLEYVEGKIPDSLNCCIPIDLPVEAALGNLDFVSVDVYGSYSPNGGAYFSNAAMNMYYRLLNCGIRLGLAAGTDFPCNELEPLGTVLTYSKTSGNLSYNNWINGIRLGHTVISRAGNTEFLDLHVNNSGPGDEVSVAKNSNLSIQLNWNAKLPKTGVLEILQNGKVIQRLAGEAAPGKPIKTSLNIKADKSCWIAARTVSGGEYQSQTAPIYIVVNGKKMEAEKEDALYLTQWVENLLQQTGKGGKWEHYFPTTLEAVRKRYHQAKSFYESLAK